ncbi:carboxylesterase/lipase family protein [Brevundimonas sp. Root1423]|uniref:carboxylesterase/lipase family protein n=1 Tax=Brevundimonas sp. Root1423 TaxID=1736462 RepID=UPI0006FC7F6A|nr:carboxylesterase/lipase family protein [Brevundimonas sp. Root1423]KQY75448.1 carboxylesterase [Brevundimonas sp. Root1423]
MLTRRETLGALAATALAATPARAAPTSPRPTTAHGPVIGLRDHGILSFKGVRYGADTRPNRFQPPRIPVSWSRPVEALDYGAASPQSGGEANQSEDCLFLNVWTPGLDAGRRPVMVYIHGGAYSTGSGSSPIYDGSRLAARGDVVVVTLNHRLNLFGYAYLHRLDAGFPHSGNAGQLDIIQALQWVRDNIAAFGGDPDRVMVFGQSGGGAKIATLMATPSAKGLFHRAATMSGQQVTASGPLNATRRTRAWLEAAGVGPDRVRDLLDMPAEALLEAARAPDPVLGYGSLYFGPVVDHQSLFRHPFYPDAPDQSAGVPMIIGNTREETLAFLGGNPANTGLTWESLPDRMAPDVMRIDVAPEVVIAEYRRLYPDWTPDQVLIGASTAGRSWRAAVIEAEARAVQGAPAWVYQMDFPGTLENGRSGAYHTVDIALAFDNVDAPGARVAGPGARQVAARLSDAFIAFARSGDPNHPALPAWKPYGLMNRETMVFDVQTRLENDPRGAERRFFAQTPYVQPGT